MRAEAVGEGDLGMLMVGNVGINRVLADCLTFKDIRTCLLYTSDNSMRLFLDDTVELEDLVKEIKKDE